MLQIKTIEIAKKLIRKQLSTLKKEKPKMCVILFDVFPSAYRMV